MEISSVLDLKKVLSFDPWQSDHGADQPVPEKNWLDKLAQLRHLAGLTH
jgi:hypothetical protein